jgi:hypothetical protein
MRGLPDNTRAEIQKIVKTNAYEGNIVENFNEPEELRKFANKHTKDILCMNALKIIPFLGGNNFKVSIGNENGPDILDIHGNDDTVFLFKFVDNAVNRNRYRVIDDVEKAEKKKFEKAEVEKAIREKINKASNSYMNNLYIKNYDYVLDQEDVFYEQYEFKRDKVLLGNFLEPNNDITDIIDLAKSFYKESHHNSMNVLYLHAYTNNDTAEYEVEEFIMGGYIPKYPENYGPGRSGEEKTYRSDQNVYADFTLSFNASPSVESRTRIRIPLNYAGHTLIPLLLTKTYNAQDEKMSKKEAEELARKLVQELNTDISNIYVPDCNTFDRFFAFSYELLLLPSYYCFPFIADHNVGVSIVIANTTEKTIKKYIDIVRKRIADYANSQWGLEPIFPELGYFYLEGESYYWRGTHYYEEFPEKPISLVLYGSPYHLEAPHTRSEMALRREVIHSYVSKILSPQSEIFTTIDLYKQVDGYVRLLMFQKPVGNIKAKRHETAFRSPYSQATLRFLQVLYGTSILYSLLYNYNPNDTRAIGKMGIYHAGRKFLVELADAIVERFASKKLNNLLSKSSISSYDEACGYLSDFFAYMNSLMIDKIGFGISFMYDLDISYEMFSVLNKEAASDFKSLIEKPIPDIEIEGIGKPYLQV